MCRIRSYRQRTGVLTFTELCELVPCKPLLQVWQGQAPRCRSSCSLQRTVLLPFQKSPLQPPSGPCLLAWDSRVEGIMNSRNAHRQYEQQMWFSLLDTVCVFIPLHIDSFPTERKEEANSCPPRNNFINVLLQHPVKTKHNGYSQQNTNKVFSLVTATSELLYLCTWGWWKPIRPSCQRSSQSPRAMTWSACGASMLVVFGWPTTGGQRRGVKQRRAQHSQVWRQSRVPARRHIRTSCRWNAWRGRSF